MKIAVVGATGLIGQHAARAVLAAGHELKLVLRASSNRKYLADLDADIAIAELSDEAAMVQALLDCDRVINCAAYYPGVGGPWQEEVTRAIEPMTHFYRACEQAQLDKVVYLGAAIALKKARPGILGHADLVEPVRPSDNNAYLQVKWALDQLASQQAALGLPVVTAIPSMTLGPFDSKPTTGQLIVNIASGQLSKFVDGKRNVIHAADAGRGLLLAAEKGLASERYVLTGTNMTLAELVAIIAQQAKMTLPKPVPLTLAKWVSRIQTLHYRYFDGPMPTLTSTAIAVLSSGQFLSGEKAQKHLGFKAHFSVEQAVSDALQWFKQEGYLDATN